jgi:hypothetical protein
VMNSSGSFNSCLREIFFPAIDSISFAKIENQENLFRGYRFRRSRIFFQGMPSSSPRQARKPSPNQRILLLFITFFLENDNWKS